ncbi:glycosyltransferase family 4 protein [Marivita sp. S0852]|uniref:glycosyltransferase family 4 protein n=1 Tax=Marivita sp. S0852 TaxID=3373893 RepID=UPI003981B2B2
MTQIFFDVSDIVTYIRAHRSVSGIQRAAVRIIAQAVRLRGRDVFLGFHHPGRRTYLCCPAIDVLDALDAFDIEALAAALDLRALKARIPEQFLERYRGQPYKQTVHIARMRLAGWRGKSRYFDKRGLDFGLWQRLYRPRKALKPVSLRPFTQVARPGDRLCGLGAIWGRGKVETVFRSAHDRGVRVFLLVHDLIPMKLPELADPRAARSYHRWLVGSADYVTGYLANSQATAADLREFLHDQGLDGTVHVTPLAQAGVGPDADSPSALNPKVHEAMTVPYALCVGTIEPRKNLWRLAQVWVRLARRHDIELPRLVLAGKRGWLTDGFLTMLERTGGFGGWVIWLEAPTDAELGHLYRQCQFTATVSLYEGWGLPIGEGLSYGKTGIVSQTSSMPEVGGDLVEYCDPVSMHSIENALKSLLDADHRQGLEARIAKARLRSWDDVGRDVLAALED